ncbi:MAG: hypothetical protein WA982_14090 [Rubrobacteraceae bacterium]
MSRLRILAASCAWLGIDVAGIFLAACGAGPNGDGSNTSGTTEAARDTASGTTEDSATSLWSDTGSVLIRQKPTEGMRVVMAALASGKVVVDDSGCIRLESRRSYDGDLIVWPPGYSMRTEGGEILIIKEDGETLVRVGDRIEFGGGQVSTPGAREAYEKHLEVPEKCTGPLWIVGRIVSTSR